MPPGLYDDAYGRLCSPLPTIIRRRRTSTNTNPTPSRAMMSISPRRLRYCDLISLSRNSPNNSPLMSRTRVLTPYSRLPPYNGCKKPPRYEDNTPRRLNTSPRNVHVPPNPRNSQPSDQRGMSNIARQASAPKTKKRWRMAGNVRTNGES